MAAFGQVHFRSCAADLLKEIAVLPKTRVDVLRRESIILSGRHSCEREMASLIGSSEEGAGTVEARSGGDESDCHTTCLSFRDNAVILRNAPLHPPGTFGDCYFNFALRPL